MTEIDLAQGAITLVWGGNFEGGVTNAAHVVDGDLLTDASWVHGAQGPASLTITLPDGIVTWRSFQVKWDFPIYSAFPQHVTVFCGDINGTIIYTSSGATGANGSRDARDSGRVVVSPPCTSDKITIQWGAYHVGDTYHLFEVSVWVDAMFEPRNPRIVSGGIPIISPSAGTSKIGVAAGSARIQTT